MTRAARVKKAGGALSHTAIYAADTGGEMRKVAEFKNGWHFAAAVWGYLGVRWGILAEPSEWLTFPDKLRLIWKEAGNPECEWHARVVLACTFDRALLHRLEFIHAAECFEQLAGEITTPNTLAEQAKVLRTLYASGAATYVGWYPTSVGENLWWIDAEERPFTIGRDDGWFWVFEELEKPAMPKKITEVRDAAPGLGPIIDRLNNAPERIANAADRLLYRTEELANAKERLAEAEANLLTAAIPVEGGAAEPLISGKNAEIRAAQLRGLTLGEREVVRLAERDQARARIALELEQNHFAAARSIARLITEGEGG